MNIIYYSFFLQLNHFLFLKNDAFRKVNFSSSFISIVEKNKIILKNFLNIVYVTVTWLSNLVILNFVNNFIKFNVYYRKDNENNNNLIHNNITINTLTCVCKLFTL